MKDTSSVLDRFVLYYEHLPGDPFEEIARRLTTEKRRILKWWRSEVAYLLLTHGTKGRPHDKANKR